ncbi:MAG: 50S ribosomal protein L10 [Anaerolineales bacterium]
MAITKARKNEVIELVKGWAAQSKAMYVAEYTGLNMKQMDDLRQKVRQAGGEFHIVKNTLGKLAFEQAGLTVKSEFFTGSTAIAFAFEDAPSLAKVLNDFARTNDLLKVKGGYLEGVVISAENVQSLAELPPLPVMRAQLLGTILAPASQLVRTLAEPARQIAAVLRAYSEKENTAVPSGV